MKPRGVIRYEARTLVRNMAGLRRLCAWLGVPTWGHDYEVAYRYLRWCKQNPQPRAEKR